MRMIKITAGVVAGVTLLTLAAPVLGETIATMPPAFPAAASDSPASVGLDYEDVTFATTDGLTLRGWFFPADHLDAPAMIYAPSTSHDQRSGLSLVPSFHDAGYHVLLFSYRGHALSDGRKGSFTYGDAESRDVEAAAQYLFEEKGIGNIAVVGHSAGAVSAILSAARNPLIGAVVAVAPYSCVTEVWQTSRPTLVPSFVMDWTLWVSEKTRGFSREQVCPIRVVEQIAPRPLLVIHGSDDRRITEDQVRELFAAAAAPKSLWLVEGASHDGIRNPMLDVLAQDVITFLNSAWEKPGEMAMAPRRDSGQVGG